MAVKVRRLIWPIAIIALVAALLLRPVAVQSDSTSSIVWMGAWQNGSVTFTNSVTGVPVQIDFGLLYGFDQFSMDTDEKTQQYYTHGVYDIGQRLSGQHTHVLQYCSIVGINVQLGSRQFQVTDGCLKIEALWPPQLF